MNDWNQNYRRRSPCDISDLLKRQQRKYYENYVVTDKALNDTDPVLLIILWSEPSRIIFCDSERRIKNLSVDIC